MYNKFCNKCGSPFNTVSPDTYHCGDCRIIMSQEQNSANASWQRTNYNMPQSDAQNITVIHVDDDSGFWKFIIFGSIIAWIAWPFIKIFMKVFE